jgi:predicted nucleotidyltransferase
VVNVTERLDVAPARIAELCRRWGIVRLELFGSVLRDDFDSDSDVDILVTFAPEVRLTEINEWLRLESELQSLFGRKVDVSDRRLVESSRNWIRRRNILNSASELYAAS